MDLNDVDKNTNKFNNNLQNVKFNLMDKITDSFLEETSKNIKTPINSLQKLLYILNIQVYDINHNHIKILE